MILLVTNRRDVTTDYVVQELERRQLHYVRLNTDALASASIVLRPDRPAKDQLVIEGQSFYLDAVTAAYFRRPEAPIVPDIAGTEAVRIYCAAEWTAILKTLIGRMEGRWFNDPATIVRAEDKPRQLLAAQKLGFRIPETVITNDPIAARAFAAERNVVAKPLRHALLEDEGPGRAMFTSRLNVDELGPDASISAAPVILQAEVVKEVDLRVTVIDDRVFAVAIHSQAHLETTVDWRRGVRPDLRHEVVTLPNDIEDRCVAITRALDLRFGAIDLICDRMGGYWFLEINPNGQWAWIENRTGLPIASAIVDALAAPERFQ